MAATKKERLDLALVRRGLAESREKAQRIIRAGAVRVGGQQVDRPDAPVGPDAAIALLEGPRFVSRGGEKLDAAFAAFALDVTELTCLDVGASTGGFTDCLLQHGARQVIAVDVGKGQLHWKLRNDPRVKVIEGVNARYLQGGMLPAVPGFACVDVSFISLTKVLPAVIGVLSPGSHMVTLIKPQFEAGRAEVKKGGVVRDQGVRDAVVESIRRFGVETLLLQWMGVVESPLKGPAGNAEYLAHWLTGGGTRTEGP